MKPPEPWKILLKKAAQEVIEQTEVIMLSQADQRRFAEALLSPPKPSAALKRAFARRRKLVSGK